MIVKLIDGQQFTVDRERAAAIAKGLGNKDNLIRLGNGIVKAHQIVSIMPGGQGEPERGRQIETAKGPQVDGSLKDKLRHENPQLFKRLYG